MQVGRGLGLVYAPRAGWSKQQMRDHALIFAHEGLDKLRCHQLFLLAHQRFARRVQITPAQDRLGHGIDHHRAPDRIAQIGQIAF